MQQVDKKRYINIFVISSILMSFVVGYSSKHEDTNTTKYFDNNVTKDKLLHAAKKVFYFAGKETFIIDAYRNDLNVTKTKASYKLYTMDIQNEHFNFNVDDNATSEKLKASVSIYRTFGIDEETSDYVKEKSGVYSLFWDRLEYFLGFNNEWHECSFYDIEGFLCDPIDLENKDATKKDTIDLTDLNDINATKNIIKLDPSNLRMKDKYNFNNKEKERTKALQNVSSSGSSVTQEKYGVLYDDVKEMQKMDNNSSIRRNNGSSSIKYKKSNIKK
mgnify:CR=1 FL=1